MNTEIIKLNLEGEICPYPLVRTIEKFYEIKNDLELGKKVLEVITDHPSAAENIPLEFKKKGFLVEVKKIGRIKWKIIIKGPIKKSSSKIVQKKSFGCPGILSE